MPEAGDAIAPFQLHVPDSALSDLRHRLAEARWPERETVRDAAQGARLAHVRALVDHWLHRYDWRRVEARLNGFGQYCTRLDGLGIHFLHVRSRHANAMPLLLTHGWPGSCVEFLDVIGPLTDPTAFGGRPEDAFDVVVPSLPGFGFSDRPSSTGWAPDRIARAWAQLMSRLGYEQYMAQGGDWGAAVATALGHLRVPQLVGIHLNFYSLSFNLPVSDEPTPEEQAALARVSKFFTDGRGYFAIQSTRPQTIGYGLTDSPVGQAAWIYEKFTDWCDGPAEEVIGFDKMLDDIMLYWLPATGASSARIYWENTRAPVGADIGVPVGFSAFPGELVQIPRCWAERAYGASLAYFNKPARGGHFAAFEQPELFTEEVRAFARLLR
ncbi:epoxide hydrolase family protein [Pseudonocardia sp. CA-142604]|uniref:epoxide hydrolase family protein n=1 Tax=Pseudonocardia sp. CA-142604 TaxID=3240024 RepID=UPI003D8C48B3